MADVDKMDIVRVADVMHIEVHMIDGLAHIRDAIELMNRHRVSSLIIKRRDEGDEHGFLSVEHIAARVIAVNRSLERTSVYEVMDKPTLTLDPNMNIKYAIRLLAQLDRRRALVTGKGGILGFVTLRELVARFSG
ncbi:MAG: CBS domain-containing protein [Rhodobacteraceae bacterium]|nr:CBS domain-containing protein [Paracoccaceae bacterium]